MKIHKYIHSCVLLEEQGRGLLFDPGTFSFRFGGVDANSFYDLDAIIITHAHPDHLDIEAVKVLVKANPGVLVIGNLEVAAQLRAEHIVSVSFEEGTMQAGVFTIEAQRAQHEAILAELPSNVAYRVNGSVVHPGDSLSRQLAPWQGIQVLLLPIFAPWLTDVMAAEFARFMKPHFAVPIHDGYVKEFFLEARYEGYKQSLGKEAITFVPLTLNGEALEILPAGPVA